MRTVTLRPGRAKALWHGHPWVFADSVARVDDPQAAGDGKAADDWVRVVDAEGRTLGCGFLSPDSAIRVRLLTRTPDTASPEPLLEAGIARAVALRRRLFPDPERTNAYRLIHSDGDGLPGLVVDRLADVLVAQFAIRATHARREALAARLLVASGCRTLLARPAGYEKVEGIPTEDEPYVVGAPAPERVEICEEGLRLEAAPLAGQKTGHYADQRENRRLVGALAGGLDVLDLYTGTGGFGLQCARHGARHVRAVDASARSVEAAHRNAARNDVAACFEPEVGDVREVLKALRVEKRTFDLVVADPPNFFPRHGGAAGGRGSDRGALKAHRELNVRVLSRVAPAGFLATFTCSARLDPVGFLEMLRSASRECRRDFRVLRELGAGPDHPVARGLPDGRYLTGYLLQVD